MQVASFAVIHFYLWTTPTSAEMLRKVT